MRCFIIPSLLVFYTLMLSLRGNALRTEGVCSWIYHRNTTCFSSNFLCGNKKCIDRELYCNGRNDCGDNTDEKNCNSYSSSCTLGYTFCEGSRICIPYKWPCDGIPDCENGADEKYCSDKKGNEFLVRGRAIHWLTKQKKLQPSTETWGSLVDKSAVAFYLSNNILIKRGNKTLKEMGYEVSIQLLSRLSKKKLQDIPSYDLASYLNAFLVTCIDPRKFHGMDIVQELRTRVENQNYSNPYVMLSLCNAGDTITEMDKEKLFDTFWFKKRTFWTDVQALTVMALACTQKQPGNEVDSDALQELVLALKQHQYGNGTVENLQTTALVLQALISADPDPDPKIFDETQALQQIYAMQQPDGSFGSLMDTYYVLPVLNCLSLVNISSDHCQYTHKDELSSLDELRSRSGSKIRVRYSIRIGDDKHLERNLALRVPINISFYGIMEIAAEIDTRYRFEYVVKDNKPYVNALSGIKDNPEKNKFWFLYTIVDGNPIPSQESPADIMPKEHEHFVMWYRSGSWVDQ